MSDVVDFTGVTIGDVAVGGVLEGAKDLSRLMVLGYNEDDDLYVASSSGDIAGDVMMLELAKLHLLGGL